MLVGLIKFIHLYLRILDLVLCTRNFWKPDAFINSQALGGNLDWRKCSTSLKGFYLLKE